MAKIKDLIKSISQMTFVESLALIETIRKSREIVKKVIKPKKTSTVSTTSTRQQKKTKSLKETITTLTPEQKRKLFEKLTGESL